MPLSAQRFRDNETLRNCVDQVPPYRMRRGERDREAVKRVQFALFDLCYPQIAGEADVDGIWGDRTDDAVSQFKREEGLSPTDPVAAAGTIGQLDEYFAWESPYPDHPDASIDGLAELAEATAAEAADITGRALKVLEDMSWGGPPSSSIAPSSPSEPSQVELRSALMAYAGVDAGSSSNETQEYRAHLLTLLGAFQIFLAPESTDLTYEPLDRAAWHEKVGHSFYWAYRQHGAERRLEITPPFRNALGRVDRLATLLRMAASTIDPDGLVRHAYPGTRRHVHLTPEQKQHNKAGLVCLILFAGAGITEQVHMPPTWGDLSSLPG